MIGSTYGGAVVVGRERRIWRVEQTDEQIAQDLRDRALITEQQLEVWRAMEGYDVWEGFALNRKHGRGTRTLQRWARDVRIEIIKRREEIRLGRVSYGCTVASGSKTRHAGDPTAQGRAPSEESSWSEERLRVEGAVDRWSRKRR